MTVADLRAHAKTLGIKGYSRMNKNELQDAIGLATVESGTVVPENNSPKQFPSEENGIVIIDEMPFIPAPDLKSEKTNSEQRQTFFENVAKKQDEMSAAANAENIDENSGSGDMSDVNFTLKMNGIPRHLRRKFFKLATSKSPAKRKEAERLLASFM